MIAGEAAAAVGWPDELVELYRAEYVGLAQLAYLLVGSTGGADELVQEAFLAARSRWDDIRTTPGGYVRQCVVNGARMRLRRSRLEERHAGGLAALAVDPPPAAAPADLIALRGALAALPLPQRTAIVLRYWAGVPDEETAAVLGCRVGTVRSHISRGLAQLRKELA